MGDISDILGSNSPVVEKIYAVHKAAGDAEPHRGYLGASIIGHACRRYLWYCFRNCVSHDFDGRMYRLFQTGEMEEPRMIAELRAIGCEVYDSDPRSGEQWEVTALGGHFSGHADAVLRGVPGAEKAWHIGEFKTANAKSFADIKKKGVKGSKPVHYAQMQAYMHLSKECIGVKCNRALHLAKNKDTDELYAERFAYDRAACEAMMVSAKHIITSSAPPTRISKRRDFYQCKWCDAHKICWGEGPKGRALPVPGLSCRQCCHSTAITDNDDMDAKWICEKGKTLSQRDQDNPCDGFLVLPDLIQCSGCVRYSKENNAEVIEFDRPDGNTWKHSPDGTIGFTGRELVSLSPPDLINETIVAAKETMGAVALGVVDDILTRYPKEDSKVVWTGATEDLEGFGNAFTEEFGLDPKEMKLKAKADYECDEYSATEFHGGVVVIHWPAQESIVPLCGSVNSASGRTIEIRRGKQ